MSRLAVDFLVALGLVVGSFVVGYGVGVVSTIKKLKREGLKTNVGE